MAAVGNRASAVSQAPGGAQFASTGASVPTAPAVAIGDDAPRCEDGDAGLSQDVAEAVDLM